MTPSGPLPSQAARLSVFRDNREPPRGRLGELPTIDLRWGDYAVLDQAGRYVGLIEHKSLPDLLTLAVHDRERRTAQAQRAKDASAASIQFKLLIVDASVDDFFAWRSDAAADAVRLAKAETRQRGFNWRYGTVSAVRTIVAEYAAAGWQVLLHSSKYKGNACSEFIRDILAAMASGQPPSGVAEFQVSNQEGRKLLLRHDGSRPVLESACTLRLLRGEGLAAMKRAWGDRDPPKSHLAQIVSVICRQFMLENPQVGEEALLDLVNSWADNHLWVKFKCQRDWLAAKTQQCWADRERLLKDNGCCNDRLERVLINNPLCWQPSKCPFVVLNGNGPNIGAAKLRAIRDFRKVLHALNQLREHAVVLHRTRLACDEQVFVICTPLNPAALRVVSSTRTFKDYLNIGFDWGLAGTPKLFREGKPTTVWLPSFLVPDIELYMMDVVTHLHHVLVTGVCGRFKPRTQLRRRGNNVERNAPAQGAEEHDPILPIPQVGRPLQREVPWLVMVLALARRALGAAAGNDGLLMKAKAYLAELLGHKPVLRLDASWASALRVFSEVDRQLGRPS